MNNELLAILEYIEQERGISKEQLMEAVEKALVKAFNKKINSGVEMPAELHEQIAELAKSMGISEEEFITNSAVLMGKLLKNRDYQNIKEIMDNLNY